MNKIITDKIKSNNEKNKNSYFGLFKTFDKIFYPGWKTNFAFALMVSVCVYLVYLRPNFNNHYILGFVFLGFSCYLLSKLSKNLK